MILNLFFFTDDRITSEGSVLNMTRLSRHDAGIYTCEAVNSQGAATANISVSVHCKFIIYVFYFVKYNCCFFIFINSALFCDTFEMSISFLCFSF